MDWRDQALILGGRRLGKSGLILDVLTATKGRRSGLDYGGGFGLDLDSCALSGANDGLTHVSPKTGRAVRGSEAEGYVDRLFPLPAFLIDPGAIAMAEDIADALQLTGYFLEERLFSAVNKPIPDVRARLVPKLVG